MIQCKLWAGAANQAFMLAAVIAHAKKMNTTWGAPMRTLDPRVWRTYFKAPKPKPATRYYYKEPRHTYDPIPEHDDLTIEGYFQCESYFADAKKEVATALGFPFKPLNTVAIHVRRGDYLLYPDQFPVLPFSYYEDAIQQMLALNFTKFKVYSDDIPWCRQAFAKLGEDYSIEFSPNTDPLTDMYEIFNSAAIITANSTFSLFPALLRPATMPGVLGDINFMVVAPAEHRWYGPKAFMDASTLMPERFIKI